MNVSSKKLNFLFVMPRLVQCVGDGYVFPLGIAYVSASLKKAGFSVYTINLNHHEGEVVDILRQMISDNDIQVVATGGLSPQFHLVKSVVEAAKQARPEIISVVGGGLISADPEIAMEGLGCADYGVIGEGEETMCELSRALEQGKDVSQVDGIVYRDGSNFKQTNRRKDIEDISAIPWPDYEGFDIDKYVKIPSANFAGMSKSGVICMLGSRSCLYRCTFCFHTNGRRYRRRSLDDFFAELDHLVSRYDIQYISMADEMFAPDIDHAREFCQRIKRYNIPWYADFRVDKITPELLNVLKDGGLDVMFFGLESADNRILSSMRKNITIEQIEKSLKMVHEHGIAIYGCFIFGDLEETVETSQKTIRWWEDHPEYNIHLTLVKPFPGSHIYRVACENGIISDRLQYLMDGCPQVNISKLNDQEFSDIVQYISEAQSSMKVIDAIDVLWIDPHMGRETISGICSNCSEKNVWENIKLFANDYIYCRTCGQKYDIPCPEPLVRNMDKNISRLLEKHGKVAFWGMTLTIMDLFRRSKMLHDPNVFPVDIAENKWKMHVQGKRINPPGVIDDEDIPVVVVTVPSHGAQISCQVEENHSHVTEVIDICRLVDPDLLLTRR
jgi:anaerobic magnesium-protoporphyrin IX monomethyl ester cyclase